MNDQVVDRAATQATLDVPGLGRVASVHADPLRENRGGMMELSSIDVILGDLNTSWFALTNIFGTTHVDASRPSYLPSGTHVFRAFTPPAFDHVLARRTSLSVEIAKQQMWTLPFKVADNPRSWMRTLKMCSDHVPLETVVRHQMSGASWRCCTWNVADPWYMAQRHPENSDKIFRGFMRDETVRLDRVRAAVQTLMERNDMVALQEVPATLVESISNTPGFADCVVERYDESHGSDGSAVMLLLRDSVKNHPRK